MAHIFSSILGFDNAQMKHFFVCFMNEQVIAVKFRLRIVNLFCQYTVSPSDEGVSDRNWSNAVFSLGYGYNNHICTKSVWFQ